MATKEAIREKAQQICDEARQTGRVVLHWPALVLGAQLGIRFLLGGVLAGAEIFGNYAPFGVGFVAASGSGAGAFAALMGSCLGYLGFRGFADALPYVAACILTFSVSFAFFDVRAYRKIWFMPCTAVLLTGVTGFVYLGELVHRLPQAVFFVTQLLLSGLSTYFYRMALAPWEEQEEENELSFRQTVCLLLLGGTVLIALAKVYLWEEISVGCFLAALAVMAAGWEGGAGAGAIMGVCAGIAMDLALGGPPHHTMAYGFSGLMMGVFQKQGKLFALLTYVVCNAAVVLWLWEELPEAASLYEVFIASVIFLVLPEQLLRRAGALFGCETLIREREQTRACVAEQLNLMACAFRELYDSLRISFRRVAPNDEDGSILFRRVANRVCTRCALRDRCWQREYASTMNALNDALPEMLRRGRGTAEDFPQHFRTRCLSFPLFLAVANEELVSMRARKQYQSKTRESTATICRQYGVMARALDGAVKLLEEETMRDSVREKKLRRYLLAQGIEGNGTVWYDRAGHLSVRVYGKELDKLKKEGQLKRLGEIMGTPLVQTVETGGRRAGTLCLRQVEPLMAVAGVSARKKNGETVSGDAGAWFKLDDGGLFVLLCDGMGSGEAARRESSLAIRLLEKLLRAGIEPEESLKILGGGLALRGETEGGFTTVDLFRLDLFTGEGGLYKLGAAPSYVKRKGAVSRVTGTAFPAGMGSGDGAAPDVARLRLEPGDCVVMISDGITAGEEDNWLKNALAAFDGTDPKGLAALLLEESARRGGAADDCTAVVLAVKNR